MRDESLVDYAMFLICVCFCVTWLVTLYELAK
jgi:hypothetical protein